MTAIQCYLIDAQENYTQLERAVSFYFEKERYKPYNYFEGVFVGSCVPENVVSVDFRCGGDFTHFGMPNSITSERIGDKYLIKIQSYGYSFLLGQNQVEPGMISNPDLYTIIHRGEDIPYVDCQPATDTVNYVYINERTTIWDAVCIYAMKAYSTYPFIRDVSAVRCERMDDTSFTYENDKIISVNRGVKLTNSISDAFSNDFSGEWTNTVSNSFAKDRKVIRQKYYSFDKEWAYDPLDQLRYRINYGDRASRFVSFTYAGHKKEDMLDKVTLNSGGLVIQNKDISRIRIRGGKSGIFTTIDCYFDAYCNK